MKQHEASVVQFFRVFQGDSSSDDIPSMISHFAEVFLTASPGGTQCVRSSEFASTLPRRKQLFERLGCQPAMLLSLQQQSLDERYVLAKATWGLDFARGSTQMERVLVDSTYVLDLGEKEIKIVLYLTHQDIMQILRERDILQS